jgi:putative glutamine amidotransferase
MRSKKPKIGITLSETDEDIKYRWLARKAFDYIKHEYYQAILQVGGIPVLLPNVEAIGAIKEQISSIDGLLLTGGGDLRPKHYGQNPHSKLGPTTRDRDNFEFEAFGLALKDRLPILGICRGLQVLNVAMGGTLYQDLTCLNRSTLRHADPHQTTKVFHKVKIEKGSKLYKIVGEAEIGTNSSHHQVIDRLGTGLKAVAWAPDGLIEAIEHSRYDFVIGVQWHPEGIMKRRHSQRIFEAFVKKASE